jgi:GNAT superfamily N-acetyltransferase
MTPVSRPICRLEAVNPWFCDDLAALTFPAYRHVLKKQESVGVVARGAEGVAVGLALAHMEGETARVLSVFVKDAERQRGVGSLLLRELEVQARRRQAARMKAVYAVDKTVPGSPMQRLLDGVGFEPAVPRMLVLRSTVESMLKAPWIRAILPAEYCMKPWGALTAEEREALQGWQEAANWIPSDVLPFVHEKGCDPALSFALLVGGRVVGWMINHRLNAETVRMTCSYMDPGLQGRARLVAVYAAAVRALPAAGIRQGTWTVPLGHPRMVRFAMRHLAPHCYYLGETFLQIKTLLP